MAFSSITFLWCFLPISILGYFFLTGKYQNIFLFLVSILFYAWGEPSGVGILLFSILANYLLISCMDKLVRMRKFIFIFIICLNVGLLFYYKYLTFILKEILKLSIDIENIILPIGISFYTFSILSYAIEVYRKNEEPVKDILDMGLYVAFFPKLVQGPIVKYSDFISQIYSRVITSDKIYFGITRFIIGLGKKTLIANVLGQVADKIFALEGSQLSTGLAWMGAVCFTVQIYYDFSGYSDMALGLSKIFGFEFKENFNYPYMSVSIKDFWRRWHISLSSWLRDYIYIPLGGNQKGCVKTCFNIFIVFAVSGIWHGANWTFWIWGVYHGIFQILEFCFLGKCLKKLRIVNIFYTNLVVIIGWVLFRADNIECALNFIKNMFTYNIAASNFSVHNYINNKEIFILVFGIFFAGIAQGCIDKLKGYINLPSIVIEAGKGILLMFVLFLSLVSIGGGTYNSFIYFHF